MTTVETLELPDMPEAPAPSATSTDTPGRSRGRKPAAGGAAKPRKTPAKRPGGDAARRAAARGRKAEGYRNGVAGMMQLAGMPLLVAGKSTRNPILVADAAAIAMHAEGVATAIADLAVEDARIAAVLDKLTAVGPYSALVGAVMPLAVQLAANHGIVGDKQAAMFGAVPVGDLLDQVDADIARAAADTAACTWSPADVDVEPPHRNGSTMDPTPAFDPTEPF